MTKIEIIEAVFMAIGLVILVIIFSFAIKDALTIVVTILPLGGN